MLRDPGSAPMIPRPLRRLLGGAAALVLLAGGGVLPGALAVGLAGALSPAPLEAQAAQRFEPPPGYTVPDATVQEFFERDTSFATLNQLGPDGHTFLVPLSTELSTLERLGEPTHRLAELELRLAVSRPWHLDTYGIHGFRFYQLRERRMVDVELPEGAFASDFMWSPEGDQVAFLLHPHGAPTELWTAQVATGAASALSRTPLNATVGTRSQGQGSRSSDMVQWTPEGSVLTLALPENRGAEPVRPAVPSAPGIRRTPERAVQTRTFPNLLNDAYDEDLLEYHATSQIAEISASGEVRRLGEPGMWTSLSLSPDGRHLVWIGVSNALLVAEAR